MISICFYGESILLEVESFAKVAFISKRFMSFILFLKSLLVMLRSTSKARKQINIMTLISILART